MVNVVNTLVFARNGKAKAATIEVEVTNGIGIHVIGMRDEDVKNVLLKVVTVMQKNGYAIPGKKIIITISEKPEKYPELVEYPLYIALVMAVTGMMPSVWYSPKDYYIGSMEIDGRRIPITKEQYWSVKEFQRMIYGRPSNERVIFEKQKDNIEIGL